MATLEPRPTIVRRIEESFSPHFVTCTKLTRQKILKWISKQHFICVISVMPTSCALHVLLKTTAITVKYCRYSIITSSQFIWKNSSFVKPYKKTSFLCRAVAHHRHTLKLDIDEIAIVTSHQLCYSRLPGPSAVVKQSPWFSIDLLFLENSWTPRYPNSENYTSSVCKGARFNGYSTVIEILSNNKGHSELIRSALVKTRLSCRAAYKLLPANGSKKYFISTVDLMSFLFFVLWNTALKNIFICETVNISSTHLKKNEL